MPEVQSGKAPKIECIQTPKVQAQSTPEVQQAESVPEFEAQNVNIPKVEAQSVNIPEVEKKKPESPIFEKVEKNVEAGKDNEDEFVFMGERESTPAALPENPTIHIQDDPETSQPKKDISSGLFDGFPKVHGEFPDDLLPEGDYDMFHDGKIKVLTKKVKSLKKAKAKAEVERDDLKKKLKKALDENDELKLAVNDHAERIDALTDDLDESAKLIDQLTTELAEVKPKYENMNEVNKTLHQMIGELHETSSNECKVLRQEIEALRADKVVKDEQLNMLYTVMEQKLGINVQAVYNDLEIQRVEEGRVQREKELAEAATQKNKRLVVDNEEILRSSSQQIQQETEGNDVEMVDAAVNAEEMNMEVDPEQGFVLIGESFSLPYSLKDVIRLVKVEQHKGKVREADVKLLCYKEEKDDDKEEEEEKLDDEELKDLFDDTENYDPENDKDDDDDQGVTRLLIVKPNVQQSLNDFLNDELNEQVEDQ
ncbi:hypothetical protein Hdeb2414_s0092g00788871 [Helianthus debilis subsp. tardiflorus]